MLTPTKNARPVENYEIVVFPQHVLYMSYKNPIFVYYISIFFSLEDWKKKSVISTWPIQYQNCVSIKIVAWPEYLNQDVFILILFVENISHL